MIDLISKNNDDNLDRVEEIYLTEQQYTRWMSADTPRTDIFETPEGRVVLKNIRPAAKPQPSLLMQIGPLAEAVLGPEWKQRASQQAALSSSSAVPARKLDRPADAVWTFFYHGCMVIGVHDDGTVVGRFTHMWSCERYRVTPDGVLLNNNRPIAEQYMANVPAERILDLFKSGLTNWVKRGEGRKMPVGIRRLKKSIDNCPAAGDRLHRKERFRPGDSITIYASDLF